MSERRLYWLKLKERFFTDKPIKKLRRMAGGNTYTIIYLKLLLLGLRNGGHIYYDGIEDTFAEELALEIDESSEDTEFCLLYLQKTGLVRIVSENEIFLTETPELTYSESSSTARSRRCRERKALQCNGDATLMQHSCNETATTDTDKDNKIKDTDIDRQTDKTSVLSDAEKRLAYLFCEAFSTDGMSKRLLTAIEDTLQAGVPEKRIESMIHSAKNKHPREPESYVAAGLKALQKAVPKERRVSFKPEDKPLEPREQEWLQEFEAIRERR